MKTFVVDPRDGSTSGDGCATCCCYTATIGLGETDKWLIDYAPWSVPLGGGGLTLNHTIEIVRTLEVPGSVPDPIDPAKSVIPVDGSWNVNSRYHQVSFAMESGTDLVIGEKYRMTLRQEAIDCDCIKYWHVSCYDITIGKC
jgi:hypothetical protein